MNKSKLLIIVMICILAAVNACGGGSENTSEITNDESVTSTQNESTDSTIRTQDDVSTGSEAYSFTEDKDIELQLAEHVYPEGTEYIPYAISNNTKKRLTVNRDQLFLLKEKDGEWEPAGNEKENDVSESVTIPAESFTPGTIESSKLDKGRYRICLYKDEHIYYQDFEIEQSASFQTEGELVDTNHNHIEDDYVYSINVAQTLPVSGTHYEKLKGITISMDHYTAVKKWCCAE